MDTEMLYLNGSFLPLSEGRVHVEDRGFQLGDGIYEVIKVMNGRLVWLEDHLTRLVRNLGEISLGHALGGHDLETVLPELVERSGVVQPAKRRHLMADHVCCPVLRNAGADKAV